MLEQVRKEPMQRMMKAHPPLQHIKLHNMVLRIPKRNLVERNRVELCSIQSILRQSAHHQDVVYDRRNGEDQLCRRRLPIRLSVDFDDS
jgi:hypothetical protein